MGAQTVHVLKGIDLDIFKNHGAIYIDGVNLKEWNLPALKGHLGGQSFEALNHLGTLGSDALVIINDNEGSITFKFGMSLGFFEQ